MDEPTNMLKLRHLKAVIIALITLAMPSMGFADCKKLVDKHLEYYAGLKKQLTNDPNFDPQIKKIPYDVKIIDNRSQQYPLYAPDVSFFYPNANTTPINLLFQDSYLKAICIIQTPDGSKWVVWRDETGLYFFDEDEQPH